MSGINPYEDYPWPGGWHLIPHYMREGIYEYVMRGRPVGSFLTALISDESVSTVFALADSTNQRSMLGWMQFLHNYFPGEAKGSREALNAWIKKGGTYRAKDDAD